MPEAIRVPIPTAGSGLVPYFDDRIRDGTLRLALDLAVAEHDELAVVTRVSVVGVDLSAEHVAVHYVVAWQAFHACSDQHALGESLRTIRGRAEGSNWIFAPDSPQPTRDSADEL